VHRSATNLEHSVTEIFLPRKRRVFMSWWSSAGCVKTHTLRHPRVHTVLTMESWVMYKLHWIWIWFIWWTLWLNIFMWP